MTFKKLITATVIASTTLFSTVSWSQFNGNGPVAMTDATFTQLMNNLINDSLYQESMFLDRGADRQTHGQSQFKLIYQNDRVQAIVVVDINSQVIINKIELAYGAVGNLKNSIIGMSVGGTYTDLTPYWQAMETNLLNNSKLISGIQQSFDFGSDALPAAYDQRQLLQVSEEVERGLKPILTGLTNKILEAAQASAYGRNNSTGSASFAQSSLFRAMVGPDFQIKLPYDYEADDKRAQQFDRVLSAARIVKGLAVITGVVLLGTFTWDNFSGSLPPIIVTNNMDVEDVPWKEILLRQSRLIVGDFLMYYSMNHWSLSKLIAKAIGVDLKAGDYSTLNYKFFAFMHNSALRISAKLKTIKMQIQQRATPLKQKIGLVEVRVSNRRIETAKVDAVFAPHSRSRNGIDFDQNLTLEKEGIVTSEMGKTVLRSGLLAYDEMLTRYNGNVPSGTAQLAKLGRAAGAEGIQFVINVTTLGNNRETIPPNQTDRRQSSEIEDIKKAVTAGLKLAIANGNIRTVAIPALGIEGHIGSLTSNPKLSALAIFEAINQMKSELDASSIQRIEVIVREKSVLESFRAAVQAFFIKGMTELEQLKITPDKASTIDSARMCLQLFAG